MSYPGKRPWFLDREIHNDAPDIASLSRRLMQWENTTFARDLRASPLDPFQTPLHTRGDVGTAGGTGDGGGRIAFVVPPSPGPHQQLELRVFYTMIRPYSVFGFPQSVSFLVSGVEVGRIDIPAGPAPVPGAWASCVIPARAGDTVECIHSGFVAMLGLCGWWQPIATSADATVAPWSEMSQTYGGSGVADSTYILRWVARMANRFSAIPNDSRARVA